jgi:crotonobetainyl-CoA:carnitine CoA-transferase CaiB-like acyl-CoA transferase
VHTQTIDGTLAARKAANVPIVKIHSIRNVMDDPRFFTRDMFEQRALFCS